MTGVDREALADHDPDPGGRSAALDRRHAGDDRDVARDGLVRVVELVGLSGDVRARAAHREGRARERRAAESRDRADVGIEPGRRWGGRRTVTRIGGLVLIALRLSVAIAEKPWTPSGRPDALKPYGAVVSVPISAPLR